MNSANYYLIEFEIVCRECLEVEMFEYVQVKLHCIIKSNEICNQILNTKFPVKQTGFLFS